MDLFHLFAIVAILAIALIAYTYLSNWHSDDDTEERPRFSNNAMICVAFTIIALLAYAYGIVRADKTAFQAFQNSAVMVWVLLIGYIDWREHIIPNDLIISAMGFRTVTALIETVTGQSSARTVLLNSLTGFFAVGLLLLIVAVIAKSALGMGDVKMYAVLGLFYGLFGAYSILLISVVIMAIISIILLLIKKVTVKTALPMAPFAAIGTLIYLLSGN